MCGSDVDQGLGSLRVVEKGASVSVECGNEDVYELKEPTPSECGPVQVLSIEKYSCFFSLIGFSVSGPRSRKNTWCSS